LDFLKDKDDFVIGSHEQPDGDSLGGSFAMYMMLVKLGKKARCLYINEVIPSAYRFITEGVELRQKSSTGAPVKNAIVLECPNLSRLGSDLAKVVAEADEAINIDHHTKNDMFGVANLILPQAPSTTEILYRIALDLGVQLDAPLATCLYVGLVTDTGRFQYSNTTGDTLRVAGELVDYGVDVHHVFQEVYESESFATKKLLARMLERADLSDGLSHSIIMRKDLEETKANLMDAEEFIDNLRGIEGTKIACLLRETGTGYRVSLRSSTDLDVAAFCGRFGGGGHKKAAGCKTDLLPEQFLPLVRSFIAEGTLPPERIFDQEAALAAKQNGSDEE